MAMGRVGYGYCLSNPLSRLLNISPYSYPIPDGFEFIVSSPYPLGTRRVSGVRYPQPRSTHHLEFFFVKNIKNLILEKNKLIVNQLFLTTYISINLL